MFRSYSSKPVHAFFLSLFLAYACQSSIAQSSGTIIYGYKNYTVLEVGNINLLLSIPHDGNLKPSNIRDRTVDTVIDYNTQNFGKAIRDELIYLFKTKKNIDARPYVVYTNLHRTKLDPNRNNIDSCRVATDDCHLAYNDYHSFIETYFKTNFVTGKKTSKLSNYKQGLIVDIHGQSHPENWIELGYYFSISELNLADLPNALSSSVNTLRSLSNYSLEEIIRGQVSLGGIFENKFGLKSVPSPTYPSPRNGNYFQGGYITQTHGSFYPTPYSLNAIQIEFPFYMRDDPDYVVNAKKAASALFEFYWLHSFDKLI